MRLKYKCLNTLDIILDKYEDTHWTQLILDNIPLQVFQKNLIDIYQEYNKIYGKNTYLTYAFNHVNLNYSQCLS